MFVNSTVEVCVASHPCQLHINLIPWHQS